MAYYLELGPPEQTGWLFVTDEFTACGALKVLVKPGTVLDAAKIAVLNDLARSTGHEPSSH